MSHLAINDDNPVKIAATGGVEAVLVSMATHKGSAGVQHNACGMLGNLACNNNDNQVNNDDNQVKIAAAGCVEAVLATMTTHKGNADVQRQACWALMNIAFNDDTKSRLLRPLAWKQF